MSQESSTAVVARSPQAKAPTNRKPRGRGPSDPQGENQEAKPRVELSKAHGSVVPLVKFLLQCSDEAKLAALAMSALLGTTLESDIKKGGHFDGDLGNGWDQDLRQELPSMVERLDGDAQLAALFLAATAIQNK